MYLNKQLSAARYVGKQAVITAVNSVAKRRRTIWKSIGLLTNKQEQKLLDTGCGERYTSGWVLISKIDMEVIIYGKDEWRGEDMEAAFSSLLKESIERSFKRMEAQTQTCIRGESPEGAPF
jgi:hypothetical protein